MTHVSVKLMPCCRNSKGDEELEELSRKDTSPAASAIVICLPAHFIAAASNASSLHNSVLESLEQEEEGRDEIEKGAESISDADCFQAIRERHVRMRRVSGSSGCRGTDTRAKRRVAGSWDPSLGQSVCASCPFELRTSSQQE